MDYQFLTEIGLAQNEAKVYITLLGLKKAKVKTISEKTGIYRRNTYEALEKLVAKGLVSCSVGSKTKEFEAINPERILSYLKEKEDKVKKLLPELMDKYSIETQADEAAMFKGIDGIKSILEDMLTVKSDLYLIGSKGYWKTLPQLKFFFPQFERKRLKLGIKIKQIFDFELRNKRITKFKLSEWRFFPKEYSTPIHIWIYGNRVVSLFYGTDPIAFMIKSQKIAKGYKKYFNAMWKIAKK